MGTLSAYKFPQNDPHVELPRTNFRVWVLTSPGLLARPPAPTHPLPLRFRALQGLWPVFCPVAFECSCLVYLTLLKVYYERVNGAAGSRQQQSSPLMESSSINGTKPVGGARRSPSMSKYGAAGYAAAPDAAPKV